MNRNVRRPLALLSWVSMMMLALSWALQPEPTTAARALVILSDSNQAWSSGRFYRTGLASTQAPTFGGVQLIPSKVYSGYTASRALPEPVSAHTSATYGDRIFVAGGNALDGGKSRKVWTTRLADPQTGALEPWLALPDLPIGVSGLSSTILEVGGQPFFVVLGGQRGSSTVPDSVTTSRIFYLPIVLDAAGNLVTGLSWSEVPDEQRLPFPNITNFENDPTSQISGGGASNVGVISTVVGSQPYIYIFGGRNRTLDGGGYKDRYSSRVYRARVSAGTMPLSLALSWQPDDEMSNSWNIRGSISNVVQTVFLAGAATVKYVDPFTNDTGVYLIGGKRCTAGETACSGGVANPAFEADSNAYVARINASTGVITWLDTGNMTPNGRFGHAAFQFQGRVNVSGGSVVADGDPTPSLAEGYVGDDSRAYPYDLNLYREGDAANFELTQGQLNNGRMLHTMEVLEGDSTHTWAYLIGGAVKAGQTTTPVSTDVLSGNISEPPLTTDNVVANGSYYSKIYDFGDGARVFRLLWRGKVKQSDAESPVPPIQMLYRFGATAQEINGQSYTTITGVHDPAGDVVEGDTVTRSYTFSFPSPVTTRFFQFGAKIRRSSLQFSPLLKSFSIDVERVGFPNIRVADGGANMTVNPINFGDTVAPLIPITNQPYVKPNGQTVPALAANWDQEGQFFVGLYLLRPGQQPPRADWPTFGDTGTAFAWVDKSSMPAMSPNGQFMIPKERWRNWSNTGNADAAFWRAQFNQVGTYKVYVMVDTYPDGTQPMGLVQEADLPGTDGETDNNVYSFDVAVNESAKQTFLAQIPHNVRGGFAQQQALPRWIPWEQHPR